MKQAEKYKNKETDNTSILGKSNFVLYKLLFVSVLECIYYYHYYLESLICLVFKRVMIVISRSKRQLKFQKKKIKCVFRVLQFCRG